MAQHICKNCGILFEDDLHTVYCDKCKPIVRKTLYCTKCGKPFDVGLGKNGQFLQTKICSNCVKSKPKVLVCDICGKEFTLYKNPPDYRHYPKRTSCRDCRPDMNIDPKDYETRVCKTCGKEFIVLKSKKQVNCDNCKNIKQEFKTLTCQKCGKEFKVGRSDDGLRFLDRKLCEECLKPQEIKEIKCQCCGKSFTVGRYNLPNKELNEFKRVLYCSKECRDKGREGKRKTTYQEKYGVDYYFHTQEYIDKVKETCQAKYGVDFPCMTDNCIDAQGMKESKYNSDFADLLKVNNISYEQEFKLGTYSYDFRVGEVLIELNPTYTHTSYDTGIYKAKHKNYHLNKEKYAEISGYRCIHVWQWDDWNKIIDLIKSKSKLYARKLQLKEITKQEANLFLNTYHLQGSCYGNLVNLVLCQGEELIQVMTFGKPRYNKNYEWELLRLCTHSDYYVVGGAERLFKGFVRIQNPKSIISYCDISKFKGYVYERLGFKQDKITEPQKIWSIYSNYSKEYITDNLLRQRGFDQLVGSKLNPPEIYGKGTNNEELMLKHGWLPVYDCGQKVFKWLSGQSVTYDTMSIENKEETRHEREL